MSIYLRGTCKRKHRHSGECKRFYYSFRTRGKRYRGAIPEARTKWQAEQAERIKQEIFEGRFGRQETGKRLVTDFIDSDYLPWANANKRSWREDEYKLPKRYRYLLPEEEPFPQGRVDSTRTSARSCISRNRYRVAQERTVKPES
jgi:hypothetical protein